jgi:PKD repeat protein
MLILVSSITVFIKPASVTAEFPSDKTVVFVDPSDVILDDMTVGQNFMVSVKIFNVANFYGLDLQFGWNSTVLKYVNHTKMIPVNATPGGILYSPTLPISDQVDETASMPGSEPGTMYWLAEASMDPAPPFDGTGRNCTIFEMTFQMLMLEESPLRITGATLADKGGLSIAYEKIDGLFRHSTEADFTFYPDISVINKPVFFNASVTGNVTNVDQYMWDFGDGTTQNASVPEVDHTYTNAGDYGVSLQIATTDGKKSGVISKSVKVVDVRDLAVLDISSLQWGIYRNLTFPFKAKIANLGNTTEDCIAMAYFNTTAVNWTSPADTTWVEFYNTTRTSIGTEPQNLDFTFNASKAPVVEAYYHILVNATGIPYGYDANASNSIMISSTPVFVTQSITHDARIEDLKYGYEYNRKFLLPIAGEEVTFQIKVRNNGTYLDAINVTLYVNGSYANSWQTAALPPGQISGALKWSENLTDAGHYELTIDVRAGDVTNESTADLHVVLTPQLAISYSPEDPVANQTITLDASASHHDDPEGNITLYSWKIYAPQQNGSAIEQPENAAVYASISGNDSIVTFTAPSNGNWTVFLAVTDNFGIGRIAERLATSPYRARIIVTVGGGVSTEGGGFPIEYVAAIIIVIAVLAVAGVMILRRRRRGSGTTEGKESKES